MAERMTIDELKSYLWQSAVLLRTNIDAGAYKQYIFPLMFFKRICDVYDEETEKAVAEYGEDIEFYPEEELHTFIVPKGQHWNDVRQVTEDVGRAIVTAFKEIEKAKVLKPYDQEKEDKSAETGGSLQEIKPGHLVFMAESERAEYEAIVAEMNKTAE